MPTNDYGAISHLGLRLANLQTGEGLALGAEVDDGVLNVTATAAAIGLAAPRDIDELLQGVSEAKSPP